MKNIEEYFENKRIQKQTEDMILKLLYESKGDLLDDEALIDALKISKFESSKAEEKLGKLEVD